MSKTRILIVEDEFLIAKSLEKKLQKLDYDVVDIVASGREAIESSEKRKPDLVLMDIVIKGEESGLDAADFIQNIFGIPVIFVTALSDHDTLARIQEIGGYGFISKPFQANQVNASIQVAIGQHRKLHELREQATQDSLTGIENRASFLVYAEKELKRAQRYHHSFVIMMIDIDHFKQINDRCGHPFGDQVLQTIALVISRSLRGSDHFGRLGGEEFVAFLPHTTIEEATTIAQRVLKQIADIPYSHQGKTFNVTVSIGITDYDKLDQSFATILERADQALYQAKRNGRNRVEIISLEALN
jgi:diguanylate cyclase (GGDEF)-like protein